MKLELQSQDPTEIYVSDQGYCCIKQDTGLEGPVIVTIAPNQVDHLCTLLQSIKSEAIKYRIEYLKGKGQQ